MQELIWVPMVSISISIRLHSIHRSSKSKNILANMSNGADSYDYVELTSTASPETVDS